MTAAEINHERISAFLLRCIGHGCAVAIDAEHGFRIHSVAHDGRGGLQIDLAEGHVIDITFTHSVSRRVPATRNGKPDDAANRSL